MKITIEETEVERFGVQDEGMFAIANNTKMYEILSASIYSRKILAVVRELSTNALDSHIEAGKADVPFYMHLPTKMEPWFSVRDVGIGLDHNGVMKVFTTYGQGTKNNTNDLIGGLGLGSKSPFAYANTYHIVARKDGMERHYCAFKDERGIPKMTLIGEMETSEPNGVEVKVDTNICDMNEFYNEAARVLQYFPVKPIQVGRELEFADRSKNLMLSGKNWRAYKVGGSYRSHDTYFAGNEQAKIIQGCIAYPIRMNNIPEASRTKEVKHIINSMIDIDMPIGSVSITANREELSYDERTIKNIVEELTRVFDEIMTDVRNRVQTATTAWNAACLYRKFVDSNGDSELKKLPINWNGKDVSTTFTIDHSMFVDKNRDTSTHVKMYKCEPSNRAHSGISMVQHSTEPYVYNNNQPRVIGANEKSIFVLNDLTHNRGRFRTIDLIKEKQSNLHYSDNIMLEGPMDMMKKVIASFGNPEYVLASTLPKSESETRETQSKAKDCIDIWKFEYNGRRYRYSGNKYKLERVSLGKKDSEEAIKNFLFAVILDKRIYDLSSLTDTELTDLSKMTEAKAIEFVHGRVKSQDHQSINEVVTTLGKPVAYVKHTAFKKIKDAGGRSWFDEVRKIAQARADESCTTMSIKDVEILNLVTQRYSSSPLAKFWTKWSRAETKPEINNGLYELLNTFEKAKEEMKKNKVDNFDAMRIVWNTLNIKMTGRSTINLEQKIKDFENKYPLIQDLNNIDKHWNDIVQYVVLVDKNSVDKS